MIEIRPAPLSQTGQSPGSGKTGSRLPRLQNHEIVQARVIRAMSGRGALISIKDRQVIARSPVPLAPGQLLLLKVEALTSTPLLRLLGIVEKGAGPAVLLQAAEENLWKQVLGSLGKSVTPSAEQNGLQSLLKDLSMFFGKRGGSETFWDWIEKSGILWESKLRGLCIHGRAAAEDLNRLAAGDLKGLLAKMAMKEEETSSLIERLLKVIERLQWLNHQGWSRGGKIFFLIPLRFFDGFWSVAQLLIHKEQEEGSEGSNKSRKGESSRVVLLADLPALGRVRAEVVVERKDVAVAFEAENAELESRLRGRLSFLVERLQERGFRIRKATCEVRDPEFWTQSLVRELSGTGVYSFRTVA